MKKITLLFVGIFCSTINAYSNENFASHNFNNNAYSISFTLNQIELEERDSYTKIIANTKGEISVLGMPKLPEFSTMIMLDPQKTYSISYSVTKSRVLNDIDIIPNQTLIKGLEKKEIETINVGFYGSNKQYPNDNVIMSAPMIMRDMVLSNISIVPFSYNPENRELEIFENIEIEIFETGVVNDIRARDDMVKSRVFENIYKNNIINYNTSLRDDEYQQPAILYIGPSSIINNNTFQQLIEWRKQRGYVVYTQAADGSSTSSIKNYISDAYNNFDPPPEYVSLIGDVGGSYNIPTYYEDHGHDVYGSQCEGDHPYSQLDGNDLLPEVILGRMSIRSSSELNTVVSKILNYEKATYLDYFPDYYKKAAMAGDPSTSGNSCAITKEVIKESLEAHGFTEVDIKTSGSGWSSWMQNELTDGVLYFNYRGYLGMSGFSTNDVDAANNGWKLPFATVLTCGTGSFAEDETSMSEKFFRAGSTTSPKGGVAAIGTATWNTHTLFNNIVDMGIYDGILVDNVETAGGVLVSGKFALQNTYPGDPYGWVSAFTHWNNLIGDAATHLWSDTPEVLSVTHIPDIPFGTNYLDVQVLDSNGNPVNNAMVSLLIDNEEYATNLFTSNTGEITFDLDPSESENMTLTITKNNHKPYQALMRVVNSDVNVNLDNTSDILINDDDGIVTAGETLGLSIPLINYGLETATNFTATLSSTSDQVSIDNATVTYDSILSGETAYSDNFIITISPSAKQYEDLELILEIFDGALNTWSSEISLDVMGSLLIVTNTGYFEPGITTNLSISLTNLGMVTASNITGELIYDGSQIQINDSSGSWESLSSEETGSSADNFNITLSEDIVNGSQLSLDLLLQSDEGYNSIETYNLIAGSVDVSDPLGPDSYGYYIYDSGDESYELSPEYDWIEIAGTGASLGLDNDGNGEWSGGSSPIQTIDIPFTFRFYGIDYNEITICTNGWIALGESNSRSFRNYPIPGAGGPAPMIAAFWDDLETSGSSNNVYYQEFNNYVVIQWENLSTNFSNDENTFQVILYNDSAQPSGDNNIKIQYKEFNNTSVGSFTAYPPIHGSYSTIGIENHLSDDGLQYTYYNNYPASAMPLSNQTALYITTQPPISLPTPLLSYQIEDSEFEVLEGELDSSTLLIENIGEEGSLLYYSVATAYPDIESPFDVTGGGPDSYGYFWSDSDLSNEINYSWIDISGEGNQVSFSGNDSGTGQIDIGFDFPFYGDLYSDFIINANGWIGFGEGNTEWYNGNIPSVDYPRPAIFGFWDDLNPVNDNCNETCLGDVYYHSNSDRLVVWFNNVAHWASEGFENSVYDFQIVIYPNGDIDININSIEGNYSATVGMQNASGTIASQVDVYNGDYFNDNMSIELKKVDTISDWLLLTSEDGSSIISGELYNGESNEVNVGIDASELIAGQYFASIIIDSNNQIEIPITLNVIEENGLLGDVNEDGALNVLDVVVIVNLVLEGDCPALADVNQDGNCNVLDVVVLVNIILNL